MTRPPLLARWLLARLLPRRERATILAELLDLFELRVERDGEAPARRWYRGQTIRFPARLWADRASRTVRALFRRDTWTMMFSLDALRRDVRYALRRLAMAPGFSAVAILSLALGIGANTAMFSIVNAVLLSDPPFEDGHELVELYTSDSGGTLYGTWSYPDFADLAEQSDGVFDEVVAARTFVAAAGAADRPRVIVGEAVSVNAFSAQGIPAVLGRVFDEQDDGGPGASPVVILNHRTWVQDFGSDPGVIGQDLRINQTMYTIVGVLPEWFTGSFPAFHSGVWIPINMVQQVMGAADDPNSRRGSRSMFVRARLADGVSVEQANAALEGFGAGLSEAHPDTNDQRVYTAIPINDVMVHPIVDRALLPVAGLLMAMVGLVLLIACANLASFLLARAEERRREIAVRLSLGAGRAGLVRQLMVETTMLALLGGAAGVFLARWAVDALVAIRPPIPIPLNLDFPLDGTVLLFTLGASVVAGTLFGLVPAFQATKPDVALTLREESGSVTGGGRMRRALVVAQVSLSVVMLVSSGLFMRSMINAQDADPGFYTGPGAIVWPQLRLTGASDEEASELWRVLEERLLAEPGIDQVAMTDMLPLGIGVQTRGFEIPGVPGPMTNGRHDIDYSMVSPGYMETMEIPLLQGRMFTQDDIAEGERVVVVSQAFERRFFPDGAVGRTLPNNDDPIRIVGVVADSKVRTIGEEPRPKVYGSTRQQHIDGLQFLVRGAGSSAETLRRTLDVMLEVEPNLVMFDQRTTEEHFAIHLFPPRMAAMLLSIFGGLALLLAGVGIFGVVSHSVARRTREVGIRVSLGASRSDVVGLLVRGGMRVVALGVIIGLVLALGTGRLVGRFLYGVAGLDPVAFIGIPAILVGVALLAAWVPARRAATIDPVKALHAE